MVYEHRSLSLPLPLTVLNINNNNITINHNQQQLRFGDRLLPLKSKQQNSILSSSSIYNHTTSDTNHNNNNNQYIKNQNFKNNYMLSATKDNIDTKNYIIESLIYNGSDNVDIPVNQRQHSQKQGILQLHEPRQLNNNNNNNQQEHHQYNNYYQNQQKQKDLYTDEYIQQQEHLLIQEFNSGIANYNNNKNDNNNNKEKFSQYHKIDNELNQSNVSKADRLIEMSTEFFIIPTSNPSSLSGSSSSGTLDRNHRSKLHSPSRTGQPITARPVLILASRTPPPNNSFSGGNLATPPTIYSTVNLTGLRKEAWVIPVLVMASLSMTMMAAFEIFVLFKAWRTSPSRRHLFLGQMLLLGLFACSGLGAILTATPSVISCATIRFGVGVAYALVFAALLVKCVFLISLNGGVYLPAPYQGLLLLFAVLIQVAIGAQWLVTQPPEIHSLNVPYGAQLGGTNKFSMLIGATDIQHRLHGTLVPLCKTQFSELLLSLIYIFFLIVFVAVLAIKSRGIRDNYREATYIGLAIGGSIPIWLGWTLCGLAVADRHKDACTAFGLIATSATVFLVMFMPKGRQLAAMGKEGLYVEDREEQFSSLSRAGSGYSPSFFHFKPIKYGVMGPMPNSTTNTGNGHNSNNSNNINTNINNNNSSSSKHLPGATLAGGDRVALVAAAPPSYTRMYHYFPAHVTHPFCFYPQPPPPPPPLSPLPPPLKAIGSSLASTPAQIAQTLRYPGLFIRPDEANLYTTLEPTLSSNPNVFFQRSGAVHPGMMY
ncbi:uncharacterized protein LOC129610380 [Condylostylus longicornis]|uniref:uncharacterized protein LOC129610380 n=1 Tax=Condylostylus longicornis TaxID=2530218 RepID=UPI00244E4040|nr:uncharacterized protein LOC129610380 [Condylostylus longicornis]